MVIKADSGRYRARMDAVTLRGQAPGAWRLRGLLRMGQAAVEGLLPSGSQRRWWFLWTGSIVGWGLLFASFIGIAVESGGLAYDTHSYWLAGRNVLADQPLYWPVGIDDFGPYRYPPLFAQLVAPVALLPEAIFTWLLRAVSLVSLRYIAGSWRAAGWWFLFPLFGFPALNELIVGGIVYPVAAMTLASLRGREWLAPWAAALHIGPIVVIPFLWFHRDRRAVVIGLASLAVACAVSAVLAPDYWIGYAESLRQQAASPLEATSLLRLLPTALPDFALRAFIALGLVFIAIRRNSEWLAFATHAIAAPTLWPTRLVPLLAIPHIAQTTTSESGAAAPPES